MNLEILADAGELVAAIATVVTLIFVAFELRANTRSIVGSTYARWREGLHR